MGYALLTALCWSVSGFASSRLSRAFGAVKANLIRLSIASVLLGMITYTRTGSLVIPDAFWFMLAGISHLCIGDMALFGAFRRLGPRLGILLVGTLAPPFALISEWLMLGTVPEIPQLLCAAGVILLVATAIAPRERAHLPPKELLTGLVFGLLGALGQGISASLQRFGYASLPDNISADPWPIIFLRVGAGTLAVYIWLICLQLCGKKPLEKPQELIPYERVKAHPLLWISLSSVLGPVVGMLFVVTALKTSPAGLVQAVIATMPVFMIPVAWVLDGNAPSLRSILAGTAAVGLTIGLMLV